MSHTGKQTGKRGNIHAHTPFDRSKKRGREREGGRDNPLVLIKVRKRR